MNNSGFGLVVVLVAVLAVAVGVMYFFSAPFKTKVNEVLRQTSSWTPENIKKDPAGFLSWAVDDCARQSDRLQARILAMSIQKNKSLRESQNNEATAQTYSQFLGEAKQLYRAASTNGVWPVELSGFSMGEEALKNKIVEAHARIQAAQSAAVAQRQYVWSCEREIAESQDALRKAAQLRERLQSDLEIVKARRVADDLSGIRDALNALNDTGLAVTGGTPEEPDLKTLAEPSAGRQRDTLFARIMAE